MTDIGEENQLATIREQLDNLNNATDNINSYEIKLEVTKKQFRETQIMYQKEVGLMTKKLSKHLAKARPYFELKDKESLIRKAAQNAAESFERKKTIATMTKDQLNVLHRSLESNNMSEAEDQYIDVIEQQLELVREADDECLKAEKEHAMRINDLINIEEDLRRNLVEFGPSIKKAKQYIERKQSITKMLESQLQLITMLQDEIIQKKESYSNSMRNLEQISEKIHMERLASTSGASSFGSCSETESDI